MTWPLACKTHHTRLPARVVRTVDALRPHIKKAIHEATTWPYTYEETIIRVQGYLAGILAGVICTLIALGHLP